MKQLVLGLVAHVDAGKTTVSEALLYGAGATRRLGRVDHGDAFLDTHAIERSRGITVFAKQAQLSLPDAAFTLLDTPGHVDFSTEAERTLQVLDYALLVISGTDGVQSHTETLWRLLQRYQIPTFIFFNKMDLPGADRTALLAQLAQRLHLHAVDATAEKPLRDEAFAACDEALLEEYFATGSLADSSIAAAVARCTAVPCWFGSGLKTEGIAPLLDGLQRFTQMPQYGDTFGASVYKISTDDAGARLTHLKITGGNLTVRAGVQTPNGTEKVSQIRLYHGSKFTAIDTATPGMVCAVTGLSGTQAGKGLGTQADAAMPTLQPVLTYEVQLPEGTDPHTALGYLRQLQEEDPLLQVVWQEQSASLQVQLMGQVQLEVLQSLLQTRFGLAVAFGQGNIVYKETIATPVNGAGHYEPLRHYAEVHLRLEPLAQGSGLQFAAACAPDTLDLNWQRLIVTHLAEKPHRGVLTGSDITDMKITLLAGRGHLKHTEGGDFREATYRAVRQGLKCAESVLLEPWYTFELHVPAACVGRAMSDLQRKHASFSLPETSGETALLLGSAPVSELQDYAAEVAGYTKGMGRLSCRVQGYAPCHNTAEVIAAFGYDSEADTQNPADSVFCAHGAGFTVKWNEVQNYMHLHPEQPQATPMAKQASAEQPERTRRRAASYCASLAQDKELLAIFERTYGPLQRDVRKAMDSVKKPPPKPHHATPIPTGPEYLLVDGYNIIFAWDELQTLAKDNLAAARQRLIDLLCNYRGFRRCEVILVFDAYKVKCGTGGIENVHGIRVVYTKEAETADMYIEKTTHQLAKNSRVRVATSDALEQMIILGQGATRVSARALQEEIDAAQAAIRSFLSEQ